MKRILLVEDEEHLAINLEFNLAEEGYQVDHAGDLAQARAWVGQHTYDLVVLDVMLPDGLGTHFCEELRAGRVLTPVLMLTAKGTSDDVVTGLEAGADDYMTKPFSLRELLGRVRALLRRRAWESDEGVGPKKVHFGAHSVNFETREVLAHGQPVNLTALEMSLLRFFLTRPGQVLTREELLQEVWGLSPQTHTRTVDNFLVRLRRLFEEDPLHPRHFITLRGAGYRFLP